MRKKISGTAECPRLAICFSAKHTYAQFIDDIAGKTLAAVSTLEPDFKDKKIKGIEKAKLMGELASRKAVGAGIKTVVFDRGGFKYHGRVKEFADAVRKGGLQF